MNGTSACPQSVSKRVGRLYEFRVDIGRTISPSVDLRIDRGPCLLDTDHTLLCEC